MDNILNSYKDVWVFVEQREGNIMPVVFELLGEGRRLADEIGVNLCGVLLGDDVDKLSKEVISHGADKVYIADSSLLKNYTTEGYAKVISEAIDELKPEIFLLGATHIGRDLAPRIASRVNTGLTADCTKLEIDPEDKKLKQTRPAFGGNIMATIICPNHRPQMSTVRPGVMKKALKEEARKGIVSKLNISLKESDMRTRVIKKVVEKKDLISLTDANIIVAGGLGVGSKEGFEPLKKLADKLGGVVGASRAAVDAGWIDRSYQVGQTGTTVKPTIYIACGISGAIQHMAGMQDSDMIIAINKNESAPILKAADYSIVGDLHEILPLMADSIDNIEQLVGQLEDIK